MAQTSRLFVTCVACWECKLHLHPAKQADHARGQAAGLHKAKIHANQLSPPDRAELIATIFSGLDDDGMAEVLRLFTEPERRTDRLARAQTRLQKVAAKLGKHRGEEDPLGAA